MTKSREIAEKLKQQLVQWETDIDKLEDRIEHAQGEAKTKLDQTVQDLKSKQSDLRAKFERFESSAEEAMEDMVEGVEMAWESLKLGFLSAKSEFMDKDSNKD